MRLSRRSLAAIAVLGALLAASCGSADSEPTTTSAATNAAPIPIPELDESPVQASPAMAQADTPLPTPMVMPTLVSEPTPSHRTDVSAYAVVDIDAQSWLNLRAGPGLEHAVVGRLEAHELGVLIDDGAEEFADGMTWRRITVTHASGQTTQAWVSDTFVTRIEGEHQQTADFYSSVSAIRAALLADDPVNALAEALRRSGVTEITVSTAPSFGDTDVVLTLDDLGVPETEHVWGYTAGKGDAIEESIGEMLGDLAEFAVLAKTSRVAVDERIMASSTVDNSHEYFDNAVVVELHQPGTGEHASFNWGSLLLIFSADDAGVHLAGIAFDTWSI